MQNPIEAIRRDHGDLTAIRRDLHQHPELGLEEVRTAELVATKLAEWGSEVHRGIDRTGVVGILRAGSGNRSIGLRADMDALPITEATGLPFSSTVAGKMHACEHDGHTTMLLSTTKYLAETRDFSGTGNFIFQPGEEGCGGALAMPEDGLFQRFPCDTIYGMHNNPGIEVGAFAVREGPSWPEARSSTSTSTARARTARPEAAIDPVLTACQVTTALQAIVSRTLSPREAAVVDVTKLVGSDAYNGGRGRVARPFASALTDPGRRLSRTRLFPEVTRIMPHVVSKGG